MANRRYRFWEVHRMIFAWLQRNFYHIPRQVFRNGKRARLRWFELHWWIYLILWSHTAWRYREMSKSGNGGWFWTGIAVLCVCTGFAVFSVVGVSARSKLTEDLLNLAQQYHADFSEAVPAGFDSTRTLTVDSLRESGYNVRRFERYDCHGRDTKIVIKADDYGGYSVRSFNLSCEGL